MSKYLQASREIAAVFRKHELTYDTSRKVVQSARKALGMIPDTKPNRLPQMPSSESLRKFWQTIESAGNLRDIILLKLAFLTGARNSEIRNIRKDQIDLEENRIYILQGKGSKDRYVLFPDSFSLPLRAYLQLLTKTAWLFPNNVGSPISARRFQQLAAEYTAKAGLDIRIHPHKLRHLLLTQLTESGMPDAQIQLISGHANRESLKIYQHVALPGVQAGYEKAMKGKE
jgi:site-specific recombinase XerD